MFLRGLQFLVILLSLKCLLIICDVTLKIWSLKETVSAVFATQGFREHMEDHHIQIENVFGIGIYGIFDGHSGDYASSFTSKFLINVTVNEILLFASHSDKCVYKDPIYGNLDFVRMLWDFIHHAEYHLKSASQLHNSGTTCLIVIAETNRLTVANVGDSRVVMCKSNGEAFELSTDQKPNRVDEAQRIKMAGGSIYFQGVWRVNGLAMSRSLGDFGEKLDKNIIIPMPEIRKFDDLRRYDPKFIILASDGLWDVMTSQDAVDFIKNRYLQLEHFGAKELIVRALDLESKDNITVLIVVFINGQYVVGSAKTP